MPAARNRADLRPGAGKSKEQTGKGGDNHVIGNRTIAPRLQGRKEAALFEKSAQKLLLTWAWACRRHAHAEVNKVFFFLFTYPSKPMCWRRAAR
jgi:hypothetical protein